MANRYWIGGAGNWNDVTHWSDSSGGVGGASVPTSSDNVYFDGGSGTGTITVNAIASMLDFDVTGLAQNITLANAAYTFNVYGSAYLSTYLIWNFTGTGYFLLNKDIKTNGSIVKCNVLYFGALVQGSIHNLLDNLNLSTSSSINTNGFYGGLTEVVNTNGFNITANSWIQTYCKLNLSSSTINLSGYFGIYASFGLINAGTSTIICNGIPANANVSANLYNVIINKNTYHFAGSGTGSFTFENLTLNGGPNTVTDENLFLIGRDVVINNTLTLNGYNSTNFRMLLFSSLVGTPRTITVNGTIIASNVDFRDITGAGTANWDLSAITGGSGDCGGNSGITFTPSQTLYFKHTSGAVNLSDSSKWFTTDGGSTLGRTPLPQDYAYFTANSFAGTSTITFNMPRFCGFDMSGVNQAVTLSQNMIIEFYGDYILGNNIITSFISPSGINLYGKSGVECKLNTYTKSIRTLYIYRNVYRNYSDINLVSAFRTGQGTFYLNGFNLSCSQFQIIDITLGNYGGYFYAGSGTITNNGSEFNIYRTRFIAETSTIVMNNSGTADITINIGSVFGSLVTINKLILQGTITGNYIISQIYGLTTINELIINAGKNVKFEGGRTFSVGKITAKGTNTNKIIIGSTTTTKANITYTGGIQPDIKFADISYINANNAFKVRASTDSGNNTNITFNPAKFWVGGTGNINDTVHWSLTSGGAGGAVLPTSSDDVFFDENSLGSDGQTITINAAFDCLSLDFDYLVNTMTLTNAVYNLSVYGGLFLSTKLTTSFTSTGYLYLKSTTSVGIWANGTTKNWNRIYFDGVGGTWTNQDDWNISATPIFHVNGTWTTNNKTIITTGAYTMNVGTKTVNCGSSTIYVYDFNNRDLGTTFNHDTSHWFISGSIYNGSRTFHNVSMSFNTACYITASCVFNNLTRLNAANILNALYLGSNQVVNNTLTLNGYNSNYRLFVASNTIGTPRTITCNGTIVASNVDFRDITLAGTANRDLSNITGGSGDAGGNSGIVFTPAQPQWYKHTSGACSWSDSTKWFSDQAKTIAGRVPLPQDDATFDDTSFTGVSTLSVNCRRIGRSLNMEGVNKTITMSIPNTVECYGNLSLSTYITLNQIFPNHFYMMGRGIFTIDPKNRIFGSRLIFSSPSTYTFLSGCGVLGNLEIFLSTVDFNDNDFTLSYLGVNTGKVYMGNGSFLFSSINTFMYISSSIYFENSTIKLTSTGTANVFLSNSNELNFNKVWFSGSHTGNFDIARNNTFNELIIDAGRKVRFTAGTTQQIRKLTAIGTSSNPITIGSTTTGSTFTLTKTEPLNEKIECDYLILQDSTATPAKTWYAGLNSVNNGNNTGWVFDTFHSRDIIVQPNKRILVDNNGRIVW